MLHTKHKLGKRSKTSHKGDNGRVLVVGGSTSYPGAVFLVGMAAYRTGVDNVTIVAQSRVAWAVNCLSPDLMTIKVKGEYFTPATAGKIIELAEKFDVTVIGNGIGLESKTRKFAAKIAAGIKGLKVIDADAIKAIRLQDVTNAIITPHRKEMEILLKNSKCNEGEVQQIIGNNVITIKGAVDKIISQSKVAYNKTGHAGMTVSGTGDILAGITAGVLAQQKELWKSAKVAAYVNGRLGEKLSRKYGYGYTASDMLNLIGREVNKLNG